MRARGAVGTCPLNGKRSFLTDRDAEAHLRELRSRRLSGQMARQDNKIETNIYECQCGRWHLTSRNARRELARR